MVSQGGRYPAVRPGAPRPALPLPGRLRTSGWSGAGLPSRRPGAVCFFFFRSSCGGSGPIRRQLKVESVSGRESLKPAAQQERSPGAGRRPVVSVGTAAARASWPMGEG